MRNLSWHTTQPPFLAKITRFGLTVLEANWKFIVWISARPGGKLVFLSKCFVAVSLFRLCPFVYSLQNNHLLPAYLYKHQANMHPQSVQSLALPLLIICLSFFRVADASVTVYGYQGALTTTTTASSATYTGQQAYNPILLQAPPLPNPAPANTFNIQLANAVPAGSSIKLAGSFMGFSIEFSVLNQVCTCSLSFTKLILMLILNF